MKKVLLLDDDPDILEVLTLVLTGMGFQVFPYTGNEQNDQLIAAAEALHPDIIVSDIYMPVANGKELCTNFKHNKNLQQIPFILMSAGEFAGKEVQKTCADHFMKKPFDLKEFQALVNNFAAAGHS